MYPTRQQILTGEQNYEDFQGIQEGQGDRRPSWTPAFGKENDEPLPTFNHQYQEHPFIARNAHLQQPKLIPVPVTQLSSYPFPGGAAAVAMTETTKSDLTTAASIDQGDLSHGQYLLEQATMHIDTNPALFQTQIRLCLQKELQR